MLTSVIIVLLTIAVTFFVMTPILQSRSRRGRLAKTDRNHRASDLEERKKNIYATIKDIEFDYEMGKLSEEDFQELRQRYKDEAIHVLKELDKSEMKRPKKKQGVQVAGKSATPKAASFCWVCGTPTTSNDKFCLNCGTNLQES